MQEMSGTWVQCLGQKDPLEEEMVTTLVFLPEKFHGERSLVSYSPWGRKESDTSEHAPSLTEMWLFPITSQSTDFLPEWKRTPSSQGGHPPRSPFPTGLSIHLPCEADHLTVLHIIIWWYWGIFFILFFILSLQNLVYLTFVAHLNLD